MPCRLLKALTVCALVLILAWAVGLSLRPALAQDLLPDGPGREVTVQACSGCHGVDFFVGVPRSRTDWETSIIKMMNRGLKISDSDYAIVADYLATYIGRAPRAAPAP